MEFEFNESVIVANYGQGWVLGLGKREGFIQVNIFRQGIHEVPAAWVKKN